MITQVAPIYIYSPTKMCMLNDSEQNGFERTFPSCGRNDPNCRETEPIPFEASLRHVPGTKI